MLLSRMFHCDSLVFSDTLLYETWAFSRRSKTGKTAEIVIDAQSCYNSWCTGIDWVVGFEVQEFIYRLQSFVEALKKTGAKLIFFFGGLTPEKKREVWIQRRRKNLNDIHAVFDFLASGRAFKELPNYINSIPPNMGVTASCILKYILGCEVSLLTLPVVN